MSQPVDPELSQRIERAVGQRPVSVHALAGGSTVSVLLVELADGGSVVAKWGKGDQRIEAQMLAALHSHGALPLPDVLAVADDLLILEFVASDNDRAGGLASPGAKAQKHAAECLAALHATPFPRFGFEIDTVIGRLHQPNPLSSDWIAFFREHRLMHMALAADQEGTLPSGMLGRIEQLAAKLGNLLVRPEHPSLLHGDVWTGNVLVRGDRIAAFIDPAVYYGDREIELAFATLFNTVGKPFFERYEEIAPLEPGFFEVRRDIYNIYPLLVHVRYWDTLYARPIDETLRKHGC